LFIFSWLWGYVARAVAAALSSVAVFYLILYYVRRINMACARTNCRVASNSIFVQFWVLGKRV
jgi:uncharacterized membrane protein YdjX (TVP38/TMEM64 family)